MGQAIFICVGRHGITCQHREFRAIWILPSGLGMVLDVGIIGVLFDSAQKAGR